MADKAAAPRRPAGTQPLLSVEDLSVHIDTYRGTVQAVDGMTFHVNPQESVGIVGESGSGKSMMALSLLHFTPPSSRFARGTATFGGRDLLRLSEAEMRAVRGKDISMVFQDPMTFLNPLMKIGDQIGEVLVQHEGLSRREAFARAVEALRQVRIPSPDYVADQYPHQLSGGMRQRALIAMAIIGSPALLIADEPTTALDVTVQAQIIELLAGIKQERGLSLLMITHDLGIVAHVCDRVYVVYAGRIMEEGSVFEIFETPAHPYTSALLASVTYDEDDATNLGFIEGSVPSLIDPPAGCRFHTRCTRAMEICRRVQPNKTVRSETQSVYCWLYEDAPDD